MPDQTPNAPKATTQAGSKNTSWRFSSESDQARQSLPEAFSTIPVADAGAPWFRRFLAFVGPGYMISVGYMDPGNWATDLQGEPSSDIPCSRLSSCPT